MNSEETRPEFSRIIAGFESDLGLTRSSVRKNKLLATVYRNQYSIRFGLVMLIGTGAGINFLQSETANNTRHVQRDNKMYALEVATEGAGFSPEDIQLTTSERGLSFTEHLGACALKIQTSEILSLRAAGSQEILEHFIVSGQGAGSPAVTVNSRDELAAQPSFQPCLRIS